MMRFTVPISGDGASSQMLILSSSQAPRSISLHLEEQKGRDLFSGDHSDSRPQVGHLTFMIHHSPGTDRTPGSSGHRCLRSVCEGNGPKHKELFSLSGPLSARTHKKEGVIH